MPSLTIGLPVYNAMPFLSQTMDSLLRQTNPHFDILVIDDGSQDDSYNYLQSLHDSRLRILRQPNMGLSSTLNRMLHEVRTPWLVRHDADDIAYPNRIQLISDYITNHPNAGMFYSHASYYHNGKTFSKFRTTTGSPDFLRSITKSGYLLAICHPSVVLNVEKTLSVGAYRFNRLIEDIDLWWRMALRFDIVLIPEFTVSVRHNIRSLSHSRLTQQVINTLYIQYLLLSHLWQRTPLPYDDVVPTLTTLVDTRHMKFREHIRCANAYAGHNAYLLAFIYALKAFYVSPFHLYHRILYELKTDSLAINGIDPERYSDLRTILWRI